MNRFDIEFWNGMNKAALKESKWLTPQDFIKESIRDKINKIKKENPRLFER